MQKINNITPQTTAIIEINTVKPWISLEIGVWAGSAEAAKLAIYPITVESPILKQIPIPDPAVH